MQIHLHEVKILQIHNARPEFVKKNITATNQNPAFLLYIRCNDLEYTSCDFVYVNNIQKYLEYLISPGQN